MDPTGDAHAGSAGPACVKWELPSAVRVPGSGFGGGGCRFGWRQLSDCATAVAVSRLPTPGGPAKIRLGGSASRATERDSNSTIRRWPTTLEMAWCGTVRHDHSETRPRDRITLLLVFPAAEDARPKAPLPRCLRQRCDFSRCLRDASRGRMSATPAVLAAPAAGGRLPRRQAAVASQRKDRRASRRFLGPNAVRSSQSAQYHGRKFGVEHRPRLDVAVPVDYLHVLAPFGGELTVIRQTVAVESQAVVGTNPARRSASPLS